MENSSGKHSRNFSEYEKTFLFDIVHGFQHIVENKKTDAINLKIKNETWSVITTKFNANCQGGERTPKQLHALYDGMKKKARKNMNDDRKELYKTGGGVFTPKSDTIDTKIIETLGVQFKPLANPFDSSTKYLDKDCLPLVILDNEIAGQSNPPIDGQIPSSEPVILVETNNEEDWEKTVMDLSDIAGPSNKADALSMLPGSSTRGSTVSSPEHFSKKRKLPTSTPTTASRLLNKKTSLNIISDRFVNRKNTKDNLDLKIAEKKMLILNIEQEIKNKELEIKNMQLVEMQEKNEFLRKRQNLEIQMLEVDLKRKQIDLKIKERELELK